MAKTHLNGMEISTSGNIPAVSSVAPDFTLVKGDLSELKLSDMRGKKVILNIFPSIDTAVCATSVRRFNQEVASANNTVLVCISKDLPFAQGRFCGAEGIENAITASAFRSDDFDKNYGLLLIDGPLKGLLARAVVIINEDGKVIYNQLVNDIVEEPDYSAALKAIK